MVALPPPYVNRRTGLEFGIEANRTEGFVARLAAVFASAHGISGTDIEAAEGHDEAGAQFADERAFVDVVAALEGVAVEESIVQDSATVESREPVNAERFGV